MRDIILETKNLTKTYGRFKALDNVNICLQTGHIYGFIGEEGAGKSTLMKLITGLASPTSGSYSIMGMSSNEDLSEMRKHVGSLVEAPALYPGYTIEQNMELKRILIGNPDKSVCDKVLDMVDLTVIKTYKVKYLSIGMKQRLGIALALLGNPQLLILDEPINGLKPENIDSLRNLLVRLNQEKYVTIFISSHILSELNLLATDYIFIHKGRITDVMTHEELEEANNRVLAAKNQSFIDSNPAISGGAGNE